MIINSTSPKLIDDLKSLCSPLVVAIVIVVVMMSLMPSHNRSGYGQNNREKLDGVVSCNCVAFRLDDIQDYFLTNSQMEVINTFEEKNASLTVGIIGNLFGNDIIIHSFLKEKLTSNNNTDFVIEIANHGWNHEDFTLFSKEEQSDLIQQTNKKIMDTLKVRPVVFIPPFNRPNDGTIAALLENDIHYMSANTTGYPPSLLIYQNESIDDIGVAPSMPISNIVFHFPSSAHTGDLNADNTEWLGYTHDVTFAAVNASMNELGYAVVTMHPQEFSIRNGTVYQYEIDYAQIRELELLIDDIRMAGFKIVTISQINKGPNAAIPEFSSYSIYAILAVSTVMVIWISSRRNLAFRA